MKPFSIPRVLLAALAWSSFVACGGSAPAPQTPSASAGAPVASASAGSEVTAPAVSVVKFDDIGVSFAIPQGMRVVGDEELSARLRTSANPHLTAELQKRAQEKKGLPLLTLVKDYASDTDGFGTTLTAAAVPADAQLAELMDHELGLMKDNFTDYKTLEGPKATDVDGVPGLDVTHEYTLKKKDGAPMKTRARMRLFVRGGLAFVLASVWPATAPPARELEAQAMLDGLHFYEPAP